MINNNCGRIMFIPLVCSVLWLNPNAGAAKGAQRASEAGWDAAASLTGAPPGILPPAQRIPGEEVAPVKEKEDSNPTRGPLWNAAYLGCRCKLYHNMDIPFNLEDPNQHIRTLQTYQNMHRCIDPKWQNALYILDSNCSEHKPVENASLLIQSEACVYLTTIEGEMATAVQVINSTPPQLQWDRTPCSQKRFNLLVANVWSNNKFLARIRCAHC
jgi:hypothetical protein